MGVVRELVDVISKLNFYKIVYSYQQGLYFRNGRALLKRKKLMAEEKANALKKEKVLVEEMGYSRFLPFRRPEIPEEFVRSWISGLPLHKSRFSRLLGPGFYLHMPIIEDIVVDSIQEKVLNLGNINILTNDDQLHPISISCNLRYKVVDFHRAYTAVHDYESSLKDHTLSILAADSRGRTLKDWQDSKKIAELEKKVENDLRAVVTEKWGLKIYKVYITDNVPSNTQRLIVDGQPITLNHTAQVTNNSVSE